MKYFFIAVLAAVVLLGFVGGVYSQTWPPPHYCDNLEEVCIGEGEYSDKVRQYYDAGSLNLIFWVEAYFGNDDRCQGETFKIIRACVFEEVPQERWVQSDVNPILIWYTLPVMVNDTYNPYLRSIYNDVASRVRGSGWDGLRIEDYYNILTRLNESELITRELERLVRVGFPLYVGNNLYIE